MRVVIASRIYAPEPAAASYRLAALAQALCTDGARVTVLTSTSPEFVPGVGKSGISVRRAPVLRDRSGAVRGYIPYLSFDIPLVIRLLMVRRPDVVVVEPPPTTGAAARVVCGIRRIPYIYYAADVLSDAAAAAGSPATIVRAVRALERWVLRGAAVVLSVSDGVSMRLSQLGVDGGVETVGNGVDTTAFVSTGPTHRLGTPYLLYAGTASEVHGAGIFLEAFARVLEHHPDARLVFMGQGSERVALEQRARQLRAGRVVFEPRRSAAEVSEWLRGASASLASVRPGHGYDFAFPTKMYASVACGTPVIYAGGGPGREFAGSPAVGTAVDYDVAQVAGAMIAALGQPIDPAAREALANWARATVSLEAVAQRASRAVIRVARRR